MYKNDSGYTLDADDIIRKFGVIIPFIIFAYGILIQLKVISSASYSGLLTFALIVAGWLVLGIYQVIWPSKNASASLVRLGSYHMLAGLSCLYISNHIMVLWPILTMATYIYFGKKGLRCNILALFIIIFIEVLLHIGSLPSVIDSIVRFFAVSVTSLGLISVSQTHEIKQEKLYDSQLKESAERDRMAAIINNLTDAIISISLSGKIKVYNAATLNLIDTNKTLKGRSINLAFPLLDEKDKKVDFINELKSTKSFTQREDFYHKYPDGTRIRLSVSYTPIRRGFNKDKKAETHEGYIIIARDITKLKNLEEERDEFIAVASHELRTPIAIAEGSISNVIAMIDHPKATPGMLKHAISVAHDQVVFLASIVNDLSSLSRAEHGTSNSPENVDITELANTLIHRYSDEAKSKKLKLNLDLSPNLGSVFVSKLYIEELLQNFMTNALKYTKEGSIDIIIKKELGNVIFAVKDTGIGISKSDQANLFNKFYRSEDQRTHEASGTGLGLYIAMKLARQLCTEIKVSSRLNYGSTFSFAIPISGTCKSKNDIK